MELGLGAASKFTREKEPTTSSNQPRLFAIPQSSDMRRSFGWKMTFDAILIEWPPTHESRPAIWAARGDQEYKSADVSEGPQSSQHEREYEGVCNLE